MTLKALAASLGYRAHGHISEMEAGKKTPTVGFVLAVADVFNVPVDILLRDHLELSPRFTAKEDEGPLKFRVPLADRPPSQSELEKFRLIFSTYQDGTGMLAHADGRTLPGWRDFERSLALALGGTPSESKDIFDVRLPDPARNRVFYGVSCKMRRELSGIDRRGRATIELSNSARKFWDRLKAIGIDQGNYKQAPEDVGRALIELVTEWHLLASVEQGGNVDLSKSCYLTLSWNKEGLYQLHQFSLALPDPDELTWLFPTYNRSGQTMVANHLKGNDSQGGLFDWYGESGGQLKYYPLVSNAIWKSPRFTLEPLPANRQHGLLHKAGSYFPRQWAAAQEADENDDTGLINPDFPP